MNLDILKQIKEGWTNVVFENPYIEEVAEERAKVCSSCEFADPIFPFIKTLSPEEAQKENKKSKIIRDLGCTKCGCFLVAKTRSPLSQCPEKKWIR